jgi:hypothetical protein
MKLLSPSKWEHRKSQNIRTLSEMAPLKIRALQLQNHKLFIDSYLNILRVKSHYLTKVVPSLKHYLMKTYVEIEVKLNAFLTSETDWSEWSASRFARSAPGESGWEARWASAVLKVVEKKISCFYRASNPGRPTRSQSIYRLSYSG